MVHSTRRRFLGGVGVTFGVGVAGCVGDDTGDDDVETPPADVPPRIHDFLQHARGYDRAIEDRRGEGTIDVSVGAGDQGLSFDPVAIRIDIGTTVEWEWTGDGGIHDVVSIGGSDFQFGSDRTREAGHTFDHTFDDGGVALYECRPHRTQRMLGAIDVMFEEDDVEH